MLRQKASFKKSFWVHRKFFLHSFLRVSHNGLQLGEVADFEALTFKLALMFI